MFTGFLTEVHFFGKLISYCFKTFANTWPYDSSVNLAVRPYTKLQDYWTVYFDLYEQGKNALDAAGIEIPFPQRVVHQA